MFKFNIKSILTTAAVVCMVATVVSLSAASILGNGKQEVRKTITDDFFVQRVNNEVVPYGTAGTPNTGLCSGSASQLYCVYEVTTEGKANIPSLEDLEQDFYTPEQIDDYQNQVPAWLTPASGSGIALYP